MRLLPAMFTFRRHVIGHTLAAPDPADLGTAFGLDACLDEEPPAPPRRNDSHDGGEQPLESPTAWLSRRRR
jgi:hypothetical protein